MSALSVDECWTRLATSRHGVFATVHAARGVDVVPVVFAVVANEIVVPVDTVKPKSGGRLQRLVNLAADARCTVLVDHYDDDWSTLWWVRAHGRAFEEPQPSADHVAALAVRYPQYRADGAIASTIVVRVDAVTGWGTTAPMTNDGPFYWCLDHKRVESGADSCAHDRQLGPYPTADAAANWKQQYEARNEAWDKADREWEGDD